MTAFHANSFAYVLTTTHLSKEGWKDWNLGLFSVLLQINIMYDCEYKEMNE